MKWVDSGTGYSHTVGYSYDDLNNLTAMVETINGVEHTTSYTYDTDNRVTSKVTDNIGVYYTYDSLGRLTQQVTKNGNTTIETENYTYHTGSAQVATHSSTANGKTSTISYTYDAWGNPVSTGASTICRLNPLRYRGYVYDSETGLYYLQSRYYNPEMGRFINADGQISGVGGDFLGYNQFAYCFNNPVNMDDSSGNWPKWIKNTVKWVAKNIVKPVVKTIQKALSKVNLTYSTGFNVSGTPSAWIFNGQAGVSVDTKGNVAMQASFGGGMTIGTPSVSFTGYRSITNASHIDKLNGTGYQIGGSAIVPVKKVPLAVGGDFNIIPDPELGKTYYGITTNLGVGFGSPGGEFHVEWGQTIPLKATRFNIFDLAEKAYIKIMEW